WMRTTELGLPVGRDDRKGCRAGGPHDVAQQQQRWVVRPMQVVESEEHRSGSRGNREHRRYGFEQTESPSLRVDRRWARKIGDAIAQLRDEPSELSPAADGSQLRTQ